MFVISLLYFVLPLIQLLFFLNGQLFITLPDAINFGASIFALHWLLANIMISSKIPWLQSAVPYDQRIRVHILSSAGIAAAVAYHALYKLLLGFAIDAVSWTLMAALIAMLALAVLWIPVPGFRSLRSRLIARLHRNEEADYDRSKNLHRLFVLALGLLILVHITRAELFESVNPVSTLLYAALYASSFGSYLLSLSGIFAVPARIVGVEQRRGILTVTAVPKRRLCYKSGQFAFLGASTSRGRREEHPFSFLSIPADGRSQHSAEPEPVRFAVRAMGDFTRELAELKTNDRVWIRGAYGNFRPGKEPALCFVASGIGTVPIISNIKDLHARGDNRPIRLFLAVNHRDEIPELETIESIAATMPNLELTIMVFPEDGLKYSLEFFRDNLPDKHRYSYYLCSSPGVRRAVFSALTRLGVRKSAIHYEAFSFG